MRGPSLFRVGQVWHYRYQLDGQRVQRSTRETLRLRAELVAEDAWEAAKLRARGQEPEPTLRELVAATGSSRRGFSCTRRRFTCQGIWRIIRRRSAQP